VFLSLYTDNFARDHQNYEAKGVVFVREPKEEPYGTVAVFKDIYGNLWDLLQPRSPNKWRRLTFHRADPLRLRPHGPLMPNVRRT